MVLTALACNVLFPTIGNCPGAIYVRTYLIGILVLQAIVMILLGMLACNSSRGTITDTDSRKYVTPLLTIKYVFL